MAKRWMSFVVSSALFGSFLVTAPALSAQGQSGGFDARRDLVYVDPAATTIVDVLDNDIGVSDGAVDDVSIVSPPDHGVALVIVGADGEQSVSYTPNVGFEGEDRLRYRACIEADCDEANVILYVGPGSCTIVGTAGADVLTGTAGRDVICAGDGNDTINGLGGADLIFAGRGADTVNAGPGKDQVFGGRGDDILNGGAGADEIHGNRGADVIDGGGGADELFGGKGGDTIRGSGGDDFIAGRRGADYLAGNGGNDTIRGGRGSDELRGGAGDDDLRGGRGADDLNGGAGFDTLVGGRGQDDCRNGEVVSRCESATPAFDVTVTAPSEGEAVGSSFVVEVDYPQGSVFDQLSLSIDGVEVGTIPAGQTVGVVRLATPEAAFELLVTTIVDGVSIGSTTVNLSYAAEFDDPEQVVAAYESGELSADEFLLAGTLLAVASQPDDPDEEVQADVTPLLVEHLLEIWPLASDDARNTVLDLSQVRLLPAPGVEVPNLETIPPSTQQRSLTAFPIPDVDDVLTPEVNDTAFIVSWALGLTAKQTVIEVIYRPTSPDLTDVRWLIDLDLADTDDELRQLIPNLRSGTRQIWNAERLFETPEYGFELPAAVQDDGFTIVLVEDGQSNSRAFSSPFASDLSFLSLPWIGGVSYPIRLSPNDISKNGDAADGEKGTIAHELFHTFEWNYIDWKTDSFLQTIYQHEIVAFMESAANWAANEVAVQSTERNYASGAGNLREYAFANPEQRFLQYEGGLFGDISIGGPAYSYFPWFIWLDEHAGLDTNEFPVSSGFVRQVLESFTESNIGRDPRVVVAEVINQGRFASAPPAIVAWPRMWLALYLLQDYNDYDTLDEHAVAFGPDTAYDWMTFNGAEIAGWRAELDVVDAVTEGDSFGPARPARGTVISLVESDPPAQTSSVVVSGGGASFQDFDLEGAAEGSVRVTVVPGAGVPSDLFAAFAVLLDDDDSEMRPCLVDGEPVVQIGDLDPATPEVEFVFPITADCERISVGVTNVDLVGPDLSFTFSGEYLATVPELVSSLPVGTSGVAYGPESVVVSTDGQQFTVAVTDGELPVGLSLSSAGVITGTTNGGEVAFFDVTLTDEYGQQVTASLRVDVNGLRAPIFSDPGLAVDTPANVRLDVAPGGPSNAEIASVSVTAGSLPDGLTVSIRDEIQFPGEPPIPAGVYIAGTPSEVGPFTATLTVTDTAGIDTTFDVTFDVQGPLEWSSTLDCVWADDVSMVASGAVALRSCGVHDGLYLVAEGGSGWQLSGSGGVDRRPDSLAGNDDLFYVGISGLNGRVIVYDPASGVVGSLAYPTGIGPFYRAAQIAVETSFGGSTLVAQASSAADGSALVVTWEGAQNTPPQDWTVTVVDLGAGFADISQFDVELIRVALSGDGLFVVHPTTGAVTRIDLATGASLIVSAAPTDGSRVVGIDRTSDGRVLIARSTRFELVAMSGVPIATYLPQFGVTSIGVGPATANMPFGIVVFTGNFPEIFQVELDGGGFGSTDFVLQLEPPQRVPQSVATNGVHVVVVWGIPATFDQGVTIYRFPTN